MTFNCFLLIFVLIGLLISARISRAIQINLWIESSKVLCDDQVALLKMCEKQVPDKVFGVYEKCLKDTFGSEDGKPILCGLKTLAAFEKGSLPKYEEDTTTCIFQQAPDGNIKERNQTVMAIYLLDLFSDFDWCLQTSINWLGWEELCVNRDLDDKIYSDVQRCEDDRIIEMHKSVWKKCIPANTAEIKRPAACDFSANLGKYPFMNCLAKEAALKNGYEVYIDYEKHFKCLRDVVADHNL